jgi:hypothetical protein
MRGAKVNPAKGQNREFAPVLSKKSDSCVENFNPFGHLQRDSLFSLEQGMSRRQNSE